MQISFLTGLVAVTALIFFLNKKINRVMSNTSVSLDQIKAQLLKAKGEIVAKIQALEDSINSNQDNLSPESQAKLDDLKQLAQQFDDIVPDAPVENPPIEEPQA